MLHKATDTTCTWAADATSLAYCITSSSTFVLIWSAKLCLYETDTDANHGLSLGISILQ
jgi:hypothetical protein